MRINPEERIAALRSLSGDIMALKTVKASGHLSGLLFEMTVSQTYRNETARALETVYTFPLAWGAVLLGLDVVLGGKSLSGVVVEKQEAEDRYEDAIADGDSPILLEQSADGLYTVNLGNLKPGEEAVIQYRYAQLLRFEQGRVRVMVPTTIAPRYGDAEGQGGIRPHEAVESDLLVEYPFELSLSLAGDVARGIVQSPSHQISTRCEDGRTLISLARNAWLDRDFVLTVDGLEGRSLASVAKDGGESVVIASFCPEIGGRPRGAISLKILVDCSGSMSGDSIESARQALHRVLAELEPADRISYSCFGSTVHHLIDRLVPANDQGVAKAARCIEQTDANMGGTEIQGALASVFGLNSGDERTDVLLITDGEVWDIESTIEAARQSGHRIFAVGVGSAPAETLLRRMAEETGGACELVAPNEDIEAAIVRTFRRIRLPQAVNLQVDWSATPKWTIPLPGALFDGDTLHTFAAFDTPPSATPILTLTMGETQPITCVAPVPSPTGGDLLVRLAGNERIKHEPSSSTLALALHYQLVTSQTSLFLLHVREAEDKATDLPHLQKIAHMQAAGWGGMGSVASESRMRGLPCMSMDISDTNHVMYSIAFDDGAMSYADSGIDALDIPAFLRKEADSTPENIDQAYLLSLLVRMLVTVNLSLSHPGRLTDVIHDLESQTELQPILGIVDAIMAQGASREEAWSAFILWADGQVHASHRLDRHAARSIRWVTGLIPEARMGASFPLIAANMEALSSDGWVQQQDREAPEVEAIHQLSHDN